MDVEIMDKRGGVTRALGILEDSIEVAREHISHLESIMSTVLVRPEEKSANEVDPSPIQGESELAMRLYSDADALKIITNRLHNIIDTLDL